MGTGRISDCSGNGLADWLAGFVTRHPLGHPGTDGSDARARLVVPVHRSPVGIAVRPGK